MLATFLQRYLPGVGARRRALRLLQHQKATDCLASLLAVVVLLAVRPVLKSPIATLATWQAISSAAICPLGWLVLQDRYDRWRSLLACLARLQLLQAASILRQHAHHHHHSSSSGDPSWLAFAWQLFWESFASMQLWAALVHWLPLRQHVPFALFTAARALGEFPCKCPPPPPTDDRRVVPLAGYLGWLSFLWHGGSRPGVGPTGGHGHPDGCTAAFFRLNASKMRTLARWLDNPFTIFFGGRHLGDIHPLGDTALCLAVMAWMQLTAGLLGSCLLSYALGYAFDPQAAGPAPALAGPTPRSAPDTHPAPTAAGRLAQTPAVAMHGGQQQQQQQSSRGQGPGPSGASPSSTPAKPPAPSSPGHRGCQQAGEEPGIGAASSGSSSRSVAPSAIAKQAPAAVVGARRGFVATLVARVSALLVRSRGLRLPRMTAWDVAGAAFSIASIMWPVLRMTCLARTPAGNTT